MVASASITDHILIVDDNPVNQKILTLLLEKHYYTHSAPSGEAAMSFVQTMPPDLILMDVSMPGIDGYETCRRIKQDPATNDIPVIFISSHSETKDKLKGFAVGGVDYISRPFSAEETLARVNTHLSIRLLQRQLKNHIQELDTVKNSESEQRTLSDALRDTIIALTSTLDINQVLDRLLESLQTVAPYDFSSIMLIDELDNAVIMRHRGSKGNLADIHIDFSVPLKTAVNLRQMRESGQPIIVADTSTITNWKKFPGLEWIQSYLGAPIQGRGKTIGFINLDSAKLGAFSAQHASRLLAFASQAGMALENARLYAAVQQQATESETMHNVLTAISAHLDFDLLLQEILEQINHVIPSDGANIQIRAGNHTIIRAFRGPNPENIIGTSFSLTGHPYENVYSDRSTINFPDIQAVSPPFRVAPHNIIHSTLVAPLHSHNQVIGTLALDSYELNHFTQQHIRLITAFASQVSIALENAHLHAETERHLREERILNEVNRLISSTLDVNKLAKKIYQQVRRFFPLHNFQIVEYESASDTWKSILLIHRRKAHAPIQFTSTAGLTGYVIRSHKALWLHSHSDIEKFCKKHHLQSLMTSPHTLMIVPMITSDKVVGVMSIEIEDDSYAYKQSDLRLFTSLTNQIAAVMDNARLYAAVEQLASTDMLTGLYNRHHFFPRAKEEVLRALRYHKPLSILLFDLDHFKAVNDTYGHPAGDQVLQQVSQRARLTLRNVDMIGRYGGEEFVILLPETDQGGALIAAERIRNQVDSAPIETSAGAIPVSISIGVASLSPQHTSLEILLDCADQALYKAKNNGRNQVQTGCSHTPTIQDFTL